MSSQTPTLLSVATDHRTPSLTRRKSIRYSFMRPADWDFFTSGNGAKPGFIENLSQGGCLLRTADLIENRRWIRLVVKDSERDIWFTAVGRIMHGEDRLEPWGNHGLTLYRYGVEFIHGLNPLVIERIKDSSHCCCLCGDPSANIPDLKDSERLYCVLCHLRRACHNLLVDETQDPEEFLPEPA